MDVVQLKVDEQKLIDLNLSFNIKITCNAIDKNGRCDVTERLNDCTADIFGVNVRIKLCEYHLATLYLSTDTPERYEAILKQHNLKHLTEVKAAEKEDAEENTEDTGTLNEKS